MASITLVINNKGFLSFKTSDQHLKLVGEFLTVDIGYMPDFARALLCCSFQEQVQLTVCQIITQENDVHLQSLTKSDLILVISKHMLLSIIETWEHIVTKEKKQFFIKEIMFHDITYTTLGPHHNIKNDTSASLSN